MPGLKLVVITGLSGAGKSHALKCFEDVGYFCVDNLPPALLPTFVELCHQQGGEIKNVALGIDIRERVFFADLTGILQRIKDLGHSVELLFLEARDPVLVRRFSESRSRIRCCPSCLSWKACGSKKSGWRKFGRTPIASSTPRISASMICAIY
jgi:RNase adaptor protein for sRNA GlmZ degradation